MPKARYPGSGGTIDVHGGAQLDRGLLDVLQVGRGHLRLTINGDDPIEKDRARRLIEDMLRRGFAIFVEDGDGKASRVRAFDPERMAYVIGDVPGDVGGDPAGADEAQPSEPAPKRGRRTREVPVAAARATAVGRTAGG